MDALSAAAAPLAPIRREDYTPPDWLVPEVALDFRLDPGETKVVPRLPGRRNGAHAHPLRLNGEGLRPSRVAIDGKELHDAWRMDGADLVIDLAGDDHLIETVVEIAPAANTKLMGLYESNGLLCTQCEAEGF